MMENIDDMDRRILTVLQRDCAISMDDLAEKVHLSRNACWRRVKRLESDGIIRSRVALLDPRKLGLDLTAFVMIRTNRHDPDWLARFNRAVRDLPEITGAHRMSGDLDYVLRVSLSSIQDYDAFYQRLIAKIPVSDISASFVMEDIKHTTELPV
ncbi:MAG: Lrp/AsnC family transcriptional regulator [Pseudomonadota bacterium]